MARKLSVHGTSVDRLGVFNRLTALRYSSSARSDAIPSDLMPVREIEPEGIVMMSDGLVAQSSYLRLARASWSLAM